MTDAPDSTADAPTPAWDDAIASLLADLSGVQGDLLQLLDSKRKKIAAGDSAGLDTLHAEEARLTERLMLCHQTRQRLLASAAKEGLPSDSLRSLSTALPRDSREKLRPKIDSARQNARILQHQSLTNWVLVQRTLLHLSQMIEIIATGGQMKPTYEKGGGNSTGSGGSLVDQAA